MGQGAAAKRSMILVADEVMSFSYALGCRPVEIIGWKRMDSISPSRAFFGNSRCVPRRGHAP